MVSTVFFAALATAIVWKIRQMVRDPRNAPLRSVTLCLVCAAASHPLARPGGSSGVDAVAGHGAAKLLQNVLLLATVFFLMCFYLYSAADEQGGRRRARREGVGLLVVIAALVAIVESDSHHRLVGSFSTADMTIPQVAGFYLLAGLYLMYALSAAFWWTRRYARLSPRPHSTGLWMAAVGMAAMAGACAVRAVFVVIRSTGGTVPPAVNAAVALLLVVSIMLFVVGVSYPVARARLTVLRIWFRHRRLHRRLQPLWQLLAEAYPDTVLRPTARSWRDRWRARSVHRRYHRRVVECRDGLVRVSPYLLALPAQSAPGAILDSAPPEVLAQRLREVLAEGAPGASGTVEPVAAVPVAIPAQQGRDADVEQLVALADVLRAPALRIESAVTAANHREPGSYAC